MEVTRKHFRFPVFDDERGVKEDLTPKHLEKTDDHDYRPAFSGKRPFVEKHHVAQKEEVTLPRQPIQMDPVQSYDEPEEQRDQIESINKQANRDILVDDKTEETPQKETKNEEETVLDEVEQTEEAPNYSAFSQEYRSFANDGMYEQSDEEEDFEDERIPTIKQNIRQSREQREDDVPFRRKQRHKHQN